MTRIQTEGWPLLALSSSALTAMVVTLLAIYGFDEEAIRVIIRATARTSVVFFCAAIAASALFRFIPSEPTRWLLRNRRQVGLSFAASHLIHYAAIVVLAQQYPESYFGEEERTLVSVKVIFTTLTLLAMIATSFDVSAKWLGPRLWKALHLYGVYFFWIAFTSSFGGRALHDLDYVPVTLLLLVTLGLRIAAAVARFRER